MFFVELSIRGVLYSPFLPTGTPARSSRSTIGERRGCHKFVPVFGGIVLVTSPGTELSYTLPPPIVETLVLCFCSYLPYGRWAPNVLGYRSQVHQRCHFACGNKGSSHPCPFFYYIFSLRCKLSTLTPRQPTVIELYLQLLYPRVHAFRYESQNRRNCPVKIKLTLPSYTGRPGSSEVPRNPLTRWDVSSTPANGIFLTKILKNKNKNAQRVEND